MAVILKYLSLQLPVSHMKHLVAMDSASNQSTNAMESTIVATGLTKETVQVCKTEPTFRGVGLLGTHWTHK